MKKTGIVENLTQLTIITDNTFIGLPYLESNSTFEENKADQYIYDANDQKWIRIYDICSIYNSYVSFNTETPLLSIDDLGYSNYSTVTSLWSYATGADAISLGTDASANGDFTIALGSSPNANGRSSIAIGKGVAVRGDYSNAIGCNIDEITDISVVLGNNISSIDESIALGRNVFNISDDSVAIGRDINTVRTHSIAIGTNIKNVNSYNIALGYKADTGGNYAIALGDNVSNTKSIFGVGFNGVNGIDMDRDNYGLYLKGFGGYDGTNLVVKSGNTETLNPNIKSVQQIINEKPDASAIPTKLSDLENDKVNITTSKDETSYSFKIDYKDGDVLRSTLGYKPYENNTNIAEFSLRSYDATGNRLSQIRMRPSDNKDDGQYVIQVQNVKGDTVNKVSSISTTGFDNQNYENGTAVLVESDKLEFYVNSNGFQKQLTMNKDGITKKDGKATEVFAADGTLFDLTTKADTSAIPTKTSQLTNDSGYLTEHQSLADYAKNTDLDDVKASIGDYLDDTLKMYATHTDIYSIADTKADLVDGKLKADQLPKLDNIAAATTTEDMITKFNALLTDLKAKGYMTADITA